MVDTNHQADPVDPAESAAASKDPDQWVTGDEPMTGPQASYLRTLAHEAGEEYDPTLTKAEASKRIDELQDETGRRADPGQGRGAEPGDQSAGALDDQAAGAD
jgi:hypothetical protein